MERVKGGGGRIRTDREREGREKGRSGEGDIMKEKKWVIVCMQWHRYERKEMKLHCQLREFLSAANERSLRRTGLLLATGEALAGASLAARKTYMWVYVWVCVFVHSLPNTL